MPVDLATVLFLRSALSRRVAVVAACLGVLGVAGPAPLAAAESANTARRSATEAATEVAALQPRLERALARYNDVLGALATSASRSISADRQAEAATRAARAAQRDRVNRVRALYMAGGRTGLYATVLGSGSVGELFSRAAYAGRVLSVVDREARAASASAADVRSDARAAAAAADQRVVTARDVATEWQQLETLLAGARARLESLSAQARRLEAAEQAAAALRAAEEAAASAAHADLVGATPAPASPRYLRLYQAAAHTCPGLPWSVLSAIGQVESGHGRNAGVSSAGAQGPMQFMPATWAAYGVDGNGDGRADIHDPADAIFGAANYLCANGAGDPARLPRAIWHYNHAQWYVDLILSIAGKIDASAASATG